MRFAGRIPRQWLLNFASPIFILIALFTGMRTLMLLILSSPANSLAEICWDGVECIEMSVSDTPENPQSSSHLVTRFQGLVLCIYSVCPHFNSELFEQIMNEFVLVGLLTLRWNMYQMNTGEIAGWVRMELLIHHQHHQLITHRFL